MPATKQASLACSTNYSLVIKNFVLIDDKLSLMVSYSNHVECVSFDIAAGIDQFYLSGNDPMSSTSNKSKSLSIFGGEVNGVVIVNFPQ